MIPPWGPRSVRAESFLDVASVIDRLEEEQAGLLAAYGGTLAARATHGESFLALVTNRFGPTGLHPRRAEAALSVPGNLACSRRCTTSPARAASSCWATHSPILLVIRGR